MKSLDPRGSSFHSPKIEIRSSSKQGIGIFAKDTIRKDELIVVTNGRFIFFPESEKPENHPGIPFQIERMIYVAPWDRSHPEGIFAVNHSCDPNAGIRGQLSLVALRVIQPGEEICYDYVMTDSDPDGADIKPMECRCGTKSCRKMISDLDWKRNDLQEKYRGYFSTYLQQRIDSER